MGTGLASWNDVVDHEKLAILPKHKVNVLANLSSLQRLGQKSVFNPTHLSNALLTRLLQWLPCLYTQIDKPTSADSIVHLCEIALKARIVSSNVHEAFRIQNPNDKSQTFTLQAIQLRGVPGDISESLCSEVLTNEGLPQLETDKQGWPIYNQIGHIILNKKHMRDVKAFGDILIPCAPSNLIISVKTESAKERLLYSANMIEGIGFGFFKDPSEFWTPSRMNLYKRMGFTAIYMPDTTHTLIEQKLQSKGITSLAINVNGRPLYRPLSCFGKEIKDVAGKHTLHF